MFKKDYFRLMHMHESCEVISKFIMGKSRHDLDEDRMLFSAIIRELQVIGEAAGKVSRKTRQKHNLPWHHLVGMRNRLIHSYFVTDKDVVWQTITKDMPYLHKQLHAILSHERSE
jgi:uncharacterized protein with HEPN domain